MGRGEPGLVILVHLFGFVCPLVDTEVAPGCGFARLPVLAPRGVAPSGASTFVMLWKFLDAQRVDAFYPSTTNSALSYTPDIEPSLLQGF